MKVSDIIGQTLGHYRVVENIGAGGMGQVYLAHDERLDRDVALKLLPPDLVATETARRRFRREALALSRLNHPNIAIIYDFDSQNDIDFLVMEHVNGTTLDNKLVGGALTEREIVRVGAQIARALEEAHENGVVHRDLKPSNVMVTPKGVVKVLDFGLAGILEQEEEATATKSTRITLVAGTPPYMPPEVLRGKLADARSDIWQLGATLYEMASGRAPFKGRSSFELGEAILNLEPAPLGPEISAPLRTIIGTCLAKSPEDRYRHAGEVRAALESLFSSTGTIAVETPLRRPIWQWAAAAAVFVLAVALAIVLVYRWRRPPLGPGGELSLLLSTEGRMNGAALSPDGKMVAYAAEENGRCDLYLNRVAGGGRVQLTNDAFTEAHPSFSPDGERIAFARIRSATSPPEIAIMPTLGGDVTTVVTNATHPRWSPDGNRIAYISMRPGKPIALATATPTGADERVLLSGDDIYPFINSLAWSPDGETLAITRSTGGMAAEIWLVPAEGGSPRRLSHDPPNVFSESPVFTADGRGLVHDSNRGGATNLWVMPLDGSAPYRLTTGAGPDEQPLVTRDGTVAFLNSRWRYELLLYDMKTGTTREVLRHMGYVWAPAFSPDGRQLAYSHFEDMKQWHIWITSIDAASPRRLTVAEQEIYPRFTRDGSTVTFQNFTGRGPVWRIPSQGGPAEIVTTQEGDAWGDVSPDGRWIAFARTDAGKVRVYIAPFAGGEARRLTDSPSTLPRWSPDGQWLLFCADRTFRGGISVIRPDGTGERRVTQEGSWAAWWPDGKSIAYLAPAPNGTQELRIVPASGGESKLVKNLRWSGFNYPMDVSPDGKFIATGNGVHMQDEIWVLKPQK